MRRRLSLLVAALVLASTVQTDAQLARFFVSQSAVLSYTGTSSGQQIYRRSTSESRVWSGYVDDHRLPADHTQRHRRRGGGGGGGADFTGTTTPASGGGGAAAAARRRPAPTRKTYTLIVGAAGVGGTGPNPGTAGGRRPW